MLKSLPKAIDTIKELKMAGVKLALITNGNARIQAKKVQILELQDLMDHIQIEGEFGLGKPDPEAYLNALKQLNVAAEETWMAGDHMEFDVIAPMKLGIYGIWVDTNRIGLNSHNGISPDLVVESISELV
jgi:putative hydrolase of the HAD superfamily